MKGYRFNYCSLGFMLLMMLRVILEITLQSASIFIFHVYAQVVYGIYILILNALAQNNKVEIYIRRPSDQMTLWMIQAMSFESHPELNDMPQLILTRPDALRLVMFPQTSKVAVNFFVKLDRSTY